MLHNAVFSERPLRTPAPGKQALIKQGLRASARHVLLPVLLPALLLALCTTASAQSPPSTAQVPGYYRQQLGHLQITALFDGRVPLPRAQLHGVDATTADAAIRRAHVPEDTRGLQTAVNAYLIADGERLTLVDAGTADCFGPGLGQVVQQLRAAGVDPGRIDDVLITHAHPDHLCGVLAQDTTAAFPNATLWLPARDAAYWLDPASETTAPQGLRFAFKLARDAVSPYERAGRLKRFTTDDTLPAHARALDTHGHTPGHVSYLFDAGQDAALLVWGDLVHYHAVQFRHPEATYEADSDTKAAIASRRAMLAQAADKDWWVAGAHLPFPGLGHVVREGDGYDWIPTEYAGD